jgi:hypothetical protein
MFSAVNGFCVADDSGLVEEVGEAEEVGGVGDSGIFVQPDKNKPINIKINNLI